MDLPLDGGFTVLANADIPDKVMVEVNFTDEQQAYFNSKLSDTMNELGITKEQALLRAVQLLGADEGITHPELRRVIFGGKAGYDDAGNPPQKSKRIFTDI